MTFARVATVCARWMGKPQAFIWSCASVLVWAACGPVFHYSDTWQLVINTGTTVLTFLAVFLIQNEQNRQGAAVQAKLDELIRCIEKANNSLIGIEEQPEEIIAAVKKEGLPHGSPS